MYKNGVEAKRCQVYHRCGRGLCTCENSRHFAILGSQGRLCSLELRGQLQQINIKASVRARTWILTNSIEKPFMSAGLWIMYTSPPYSAAQLDHIIEQVLD